MYSTLFHKSYELVKWLYPVINRFPKSQRFIISQRIENISFNILEMVIGLNYKDSKFARRKISEEIAKLQIFMRMSKDLSFLDFRRYEHVAKLLKEMEDIIDRGGACGPNLQEFVQ